MKALCLILMTLLLSGCFDYSDGSRSGIVSKFSHKGIFWKSWEGQMNLGGMTNDSEGNLVSNVWEFSIDNNDPKLNELVSKVQEAQESGKRVKITYKQELFVAAWRAKTNYLIQKVE